jgi:hypothetical protein
VIIILVTAVTVIAAGAWLKWATLPVLMAYEVGRQVQRVKDRTGPAPPPARARGPVKPGNQRGR